jgi:hypothetical protein
MGRLGLPQISLLLMLLAAGSTTTWATEYAQSLRFSCFKDPFLSVSVSAPRHDSFVNIDLGLVDPDGRTAGSGHHGPSIPRSQYGRLVEIPSHPEYSKAVAVEICGAMPGAYLISVSEHGNFDYRLMVSGDDGTQSNEGNETQPVHLHAEGDRMCHFRFNFRMAKGKVAIQWLDNTSHPLRFAEFPTCELIPRA